MRLGIALVACLVAGCTPRDDVAATHSAYYQCVSSLARGYGGEGKASPREASASIAKCEGKLETAARVRAKHRAKLPALRGMTEEQAYQDGLDIFRGLALCRLSQEIATRECPIA
jgi:hypothetical protein